MSGRATSVASGHAQHRLLRLQAVERLAQLPVLLLLCEHQAARRAICASSGAISSRMRCVSLSSNGGEEVVAHAVRVPLGIVSD